MRTLKLVFFTVTLVTALSLSAASFATSVSVADTLSTLALLGVFPNPQEAPQPQVLVEPANPNQTHEQLPSDGFVGPTVGEAVTATVIDLPETSANVIPNAPRQDAAMNPLADGQAQFQLPWLEEGEIINLKRESPEEIEFGQNMKFVATLVNPTDARLNLVAEVLIRKGDGSLETLIPNYRLQLGKGQAFRVPVGMAAKSRRFPPGLTQFVAFLRDQQGALIDQASITFKITVPLH